MDELEQRRRLKRFHADPMGELLATLDEATQVMIGALQARRRPRSMLHWWASLPLVDLATVLLLFAWHWALSLPLTANEVLLTVMLWMILRLSLRVTLILHAMVVRRRRK